MPAIYARDSVTFFESIWKPSHFPVTYILHFRGTRVTPFSAPSWRLTQGTACSGEFSHRTPISGLHAIYCSRRLLGWLVGFLCWFYFCRLCPFSSQDAIFYIHLPWFLAFALFAPWYVSDSASVSGYIVVYYLLFFWLYYHLQYQVSLLWSFSSGSQFKVNPACNTNLTGNFWTF